MVSAGEIRDIRWLGIRSSATDTMATATSIKRYRAETFGHRHIVEIVGFGIEGGLCGVRFCSTMIATATRFPAISPAATMRQAIMTNTRLIWLSAAPRALRRPMVRTRCSIIISRLDMSVNPVTQPISESITTILVSSSSSQLKYMALKWCLRCRCGMIRSILWSADARIGTARSDAVASSIMSVSRPLMSMDVLKSGCRCG